jgi:hypothetical protein
MIRKVALVQALREAFPKSFSGLYDQAEMGGEEPEAEPKDVTPPRKEWNKTDVRGRTVKPAQPSEDELVELELKLNTALDEALVEKRIAKADYDKYQADATKHMKAGDFPQYVEATIARLPKQEDEAPHGDEQPDLIEDPPIF